MEVEFVTLGDAAKLLNEPAPTLRGWCDKLEELGVHVLDRTDSGNRIFYDDDMEIFRFISEQKAKHGRKTTTTQLAWVIHNDENLKKRSKKDAFAPAKYVPPLGEMDTEGIINHPTMQKVLNEMVETASDMLKPKIIKEVKDDIKQDFDKRIDDIEERRVKAMQELIAKEEETQKMIKDYLDLPPLKRLFAKNPMKK